MIVIAHNIRSLHNVGSIFRSCDVFSVEKLYLTGYTGAPPRKEIAKVSLGSEHHIPWEQSEDAYQIIKQLKERGYYIVALDNAEGSIPISECSTEKPLALLLGNEVEGISDELRTQCDIQVEISMPGRKQSLNVSVATGIALFALQSNPG